MTLHYGHRERLRSRARRDGVEQFAYHEAIELLLSYAIARGDTNPLAHRLIDYFGSFKAVMEATPAQLMRVEGVGEEAATLISSVRPMIRLYQRSVNEEWRVLNNHADVIAFCKALLLGMRNEQFCVICLSPTMHVLGHRVISEGDLMKVQASPRAVVEAALSFNACVVVLCHNHPGGSAQPSEDDLRVTRELASALKMMDIRLMDHVIIGEQDTYSMTLNDDIFGLSRRKLKRPSPTKPEKDKEAAHETFTSHDAPDDSAASDADAAGRHVLHGDHRHDLLEGSPRPEGEGL